MSSSATMQAVIVDDEKPARDELAYLLKGFPDVSVVGQGKNGLEAVALIKASMVLLSPDQDIRISARNRLDGTISAIIRGSVNCEVKLRLGAGRVLTSIITEEALKELDLAVGQPCTAVIKASHVLMAVND